MAIRLNGSTSGYIEIDAPAVAGTTAITLPATSGGNFVVTDSAGDLNIDSGTFFVDASTNRVGVGTSSPGAALHVKSSGEVLRLESTQAQGLNYIGFYDSSARKGYFGFAAGADDDFMIWSEENDVIRIGTNNSERVRITETGSVGIGTTSPSETLHVAGDMRVGTGSGSGNTIHFSRSGQTDAARIACDASSNLAFHTNAGERMRIDSSGNVGIGTSSPDALLTAKASSGKIARFRTADTNFFGIDIGTNGSNYTFIESVKGGTGSYQPLSFWVGGSRAVDIDTSGRVGIGTTSPQQKQHIHENSTAASVTQYTNSVTGSGAGDGFLVGLDSTEDGLLWVKESQNLTFGTSNTERARLDSSGRLLVGTSSAINASGYTNAGLQVAGTGDPAAINTVRYDNTQYANAFNIAKSRGASVGTNTIVQNNDVIGQINFAGADGAAFIPAADISAEVDGTPGSNDMPGRLVFSTTADGASAPSERMRINSDGITAVCSGSGAGTSLYVSSPESAGTSNYLIQGRYSGGILSGTQSFRVYTNGNVQNTNNSYGAISDAKLKENIVNASSQWDDLKAIQVRNYNFKEGQTHTQLGVVAQEVELVSPGLVTESPDIDEEGNDLGTVTKSVNYSVLYMKAVKALQEAMERIETLEAKVAALEGN